METARPKPGMKRGECKPQASMPTQQVRFGRVVVGA